jgi:hypothetical protein
MSNYHAVIFADELGLPEALPVQADEFVCARCNLVANNIRMRADIWNQRLYDVECAEEVFGGLVEFMPRGLVK